MSSPIQVLHSSRPWGRGWPLAAAVVAVSLAVAGAVGLASSKSSGQGGLHLAQQANVALPAGAPLLQVERATRGRPIPAGFVGLSLEFPAVAAYAGVDRGAVNPVLAQLIRNLAPGQAPSLRIGGDSTDWTWSAVQNVARPAGVNYSLSPNWLAVTRALASATASRLILGVNLEANSRTVMAAEARALVTGLGTNRVQALEPGNEPELYGTFTWDGSGAPGRPHNYDFSGFTGDFSRLTKTLRAKLAGPAIGAPGWMRHLSRFLAAEPRVRVATLHRYPLQLCYVPRAKPNYPTIGHLLSDAASRGLADSVTPYVAISHAHGIPLRIDEMNTISCGGNDSVAKSFASALWALDALFQMARVGVDGVNIHTYPGATYELFRFGRNNGRWHAFVEPEYYGMLMFAQAAPPGSRLLQVSGTPGDRIKVWATRAPDGTIRVVLINETGKRRVVAVSPPAPPAATGTATLDLLRAPSLRARRHVTLGGLSFGKTTTGLLIGAGSSVSGVRPTGGKYVVKLPAAGAAMLTLH